MGFLCSNMSVLTILIALRVNVTFTRVNNLIALRVNVTITRVNNTMSICVDYKSNMIISTACAL